MTPRTSAELRTLGLAWCILSALGALAGGLWGWLTREDDNA